MKAFFCLCCKSYLLPNYCCKCRQESFISSCCWTKIKEEKDSEKDCAYSQGHWGGRGLRCWGRGRLWFLFAPFLIGFYFLQMTWSLVEPIVTCNSRVWIDVISKFRTIQPCWAFEAESTFVCTCSLSFNQRVWHLSFTWSWQELVPVKNGKPADDDDDSSDEDMESEEDEKVWSW